MSTPQYQPSPSERGGESRLPMESPTAPSPTCCPTTPTLIVLFILCGIFYVFGCVFEYNLCENVRFGELNIEFKNVKCEFGDLKNEIIIFNTGFENGALSPTPAPPSIYLQRYLILLIHVLDYVKILIWNIYLLMK